MPRPSRSPKRAETPRTRAPRTAPGRLAGAARWLLAAWLLAVCPAGRGEKLELVNGAVVEGDLLNPDEDPRQTYRLQLPGGAIATFAADAVRKVTPKSEAQRHYERLTDIKDSADEHYRIGTICRDQGLTEQARRHFQRAVELDPQHEKARFALGYQRIGADWRLPDAHYRKLGMVPYKGGWAYPQDAHLEQQRSDNEAAERELRNQIRMWRSWMRRRGKEAEALANLSGIDDPLASSVLAKMLLDPDEPQALKLVYAKVLARLNTPAAIAALSQAALVDIDAQVRSSSLDLLADLENTDQPAAIFLAALQQKDPAVINRAGAALARLKREDAVPYLIDALVVERTVQVGGGGGSINPTFGGPGGGGGGLNINSGPKLQKVLQRHEGVRDALIVLTGVNQFDYNEEGWRQWYIQSNTPVDVQLRRRR